MWPCTADKFNACDHGFSSCWHTQSHNTGIATPDNKTGSNHWFDSYHIWNFQQTPWHPLTIPWQRRMDSLGTSIPTPKRWSFAQTHLLMECLASWQSNTLVHPNVLLTQLPCQTSPKQTETKTCQIQQPDSRSLWKMAKMCLSQRCTPSALAHVPKSHSTTTWPDVGSNPCFQHTVWSPSFQLDDFH